MRETISEMEFQVGVMIGHYAQFNSINNFNLYMPTAKEEHDIYASDWVYKNATGIPFYLQFKASKKVIKKRLDERLAIGIKDRNKVYEFNIYRDNSKDANQHNKLFDFLFLEAYSFYVAPIFTSRDKLYHNIKYWVLGISNHTAYKLFIDKSTTWRHNLSRIRDFSFFKEVIYIKPHKKIFDLQGHHYCFNRKHEVSFHSEPKQVERQYVKNGYAFTKDIVDSILNTDNNDLQSLLSITNKHYNLILDYLNFENIQLLRKAKFINILDENEEAITNNQLIKKIEELYKEQSGLYVETINLLFEEIFNIRFGFVYKTI